MGELLGAWDVYLPGLTSIQAEKLIVLAQTWSNVISPHSVDPEVSCTSYWCRDTVIAVLSIMHKVCQNGDITHAERSMCQDSFQYDCQEWLERSRSESAVKFSPMVCKGGFSWDVCLSYLFEEQAIEIVGVALKWPNVSEPHVIDGRVWKKWYWDYATTRMMLDIVREVRVVTDVTPTERKIAHRLQGEYETWLAQACCVEDDGGYWKH